MLTTIKTTASTLYIFIATSLGTTAVGNTSVFLVQLPSTSLAWCADVALMVRIFRIAQTQPSFPEVLLLRCTCCVPFIWIQIWALCLKLSPVDLVPVVVLRTIRGSIACKTGTMRRCPIVMHLTASLDPLDFGSLNQSGLRRF